MSTALAPEPLDLDVIEMRANATTAGPWVALTTGRAGGDHWYVCDDGESIASIHANDGSDEQQRQPDAEFIAHAREDVPALIAEVRRLRADYETVRAQRSTALRSVEELQRRIDDMESDRASWENEVIDALNIEDDDDIAQSEIILRHIKSLAVASPSTARLQAVINNARLTAESGFYGIGHVIEVLASAAPSSALEAVKAETVPNITAEMVERAAIGLDEDAFSLTPEEFRSEYGGFPEWSSGYQASRQRRARQTVRSVLAYAFDRPVATEGESRG